MPLAAGRCQLPQLAFGHARIVLQLQGYKGRAIRSCWAHSANEQAFGGAAGVALDRELALPLLQADQGFEGFWVQVDLQVHGITLSLH
jgi:hypothetical protein